MNKTDAIKFLADNGIRQLNKGESLADAIASVKNKSARVGYKYLNEDGTKMSNGEIIANENREAFAKTFTPPTYNHEELTDLENAEDVRHDKDVIGVLENCTFCGCAIHIDADQLCDRNYLCCSDKSCSSSQTMQLCM